MLESAAIINDFNPKKVTPQNDIPEIKSIGRYSVIRQLGQGAMGKVYLAEDPFIERKVAIKTAIARASTDQEIRQEQRQFFNEARAAGKLLHSNIVALYDAFMEDRTFYLIMEYVHGLTLQEYINTDKKLSIESIIDVIFQCAKALDHAHDNKIIHRDIKPGNILFDKDGTVKITDFGIAVIDGFSEKKSSDTFTGSVYYTSPEVLKNEELTVQSDIFSLGVVMYELIAGKKPFPGDNDINVFYNILNSDPLPLKKYNKNIPQFLEDIVLKTLKKDPSERFSSAAALAAAFSGSINNIPFLADNTASNEKNNILKKLHFFKDFTDMELAEILANSQWIECQADSQILSDGEIDDCFYIIVLGEVDVKKNKATLARLKQGDCFGEMAYLGNTKRTADIISVSRTVLIKINAAIMEKASIEAQNKFYKIFSYTLIQRLTRANHVRMNK